MSPGRAVFAGTPEFARVALESLQQAGVEIALVLTQPDRPAGRGLRLQESAVKQFALRHGMPVAQPRSLRLDGKYPQDAEAARDALRAANADVMVVAAYGLILPQWVLDLMACDEAPRHKRLGCLNIHASLLPRWRGAAPIHRAIEAGDTDTGITLMQMDAGLDTGGVLACEAIAIADDDTTGSLHDRLAALGGRMIVQAVQTAASTGPLVATPQPVAGVTYARKVEKAEAAVDWSHNAAQIGRRIRAFDPFPGAFTTFGGEALKLWRYVIDSNPGTTGVREGTILSINSSGEAAGITVQCGGGSTLRLTELQRAGGKRVAAADFLRGHALAVGQRLGD